MRSIRSLIPLLAALVVGTISCSDSNAPDTTRPPQDLNFARLASGTPSLLNAEESFYAKKGEDREVRIFFQSSTGDGEEEFLRLRVRPGSLLARPDGTPFQNGDSVLITVRVADPVNILFDLEPSGLSFSPAEPAEIKIHYNHADHDFNEDHSIDVLDSQIKAQLSIWRQETLSDPFIRVGSVNAEDLEEIDADILGFSRYAIAY